MPKYKTSGEESLRRKAVRVFCVGAMFALSFGILICRAAFFHLNQDDKLELLALRQYRTAVKQSSKRGKIVDAVGRELAVNVQVESIYANPQEIKDPLGSAKVFSKLLGVKETVLSRRFQSNRKFIWVKRRVSDKLAKRVHALKVPGIYAMDESRRAYPNGKLASTVLGAVGFDAQALGGVETSYNDILLSQHTPGRYRKDARGHVYLSPTDISRTKELAQIQLTIDKTLQYTTERELERAVKAGKARGGVALVIDSKNGDVLAMASYPSFDPNKYSSFAPEFWKNRTITDVYEPGSTLKVMVVAAALEAGLIKAEEVFDCENGTYKVGPDVVRDTHAYDKLSVAEIIKLSSNIGAGKIGQLFSRSELYEVMQAFGMGKKTRIGLPAESAGILPEAKKWSELRHVTVSFGQGISSTPLQIAMAFAAVANGGELLRPRIVKAITAEDGTTLEVPGREVVGRPLRPATAHLVTSLMEGVVQPGGTGELAASSDYSIAGKTGTAQKAKLRASGYAKGKYFSSFVGFAPSNDPRIVVYVGIDEPGESYYYGGQVAGPAFRKIVDESLHYLKVPSQFVATKTNIDFSETLKAKTYVTNFSKRHHVTLLNEDKLKLPDLKGLTMRGVLQALGQADLDVKFKGSGVVATQRPRAGSVVPSGSEFTVSFKHIL